jgi:hypothetical protein
MGISRLTFCTLYRCLVAVLLIIVSSGCEGQLHITSDRDGSESPSTIDATNDPDEDASPGETDASEPSRFAPRRSMAQLNRVEYVNSVKAVLGDDVDLQINELQPDPSSNQGFQFGSELSREVTASATSVHRYSRASQAAARQVFSNDSRAEFVGCEPQTAGDECVHAFLSRILQRAWRRPARSAEIQRYLKIVETAEQEDELWLGLELTVAAILESPNFLYLPEVGEPAVNGVRKLTDWEMASRLSYLIVDAPPDDELVAAAGAGELSNAGQIEAAARRLLDKPAARDGLMAFFTDLMDLDKLDRLDKDPATFGDLPSSLGPSMRADVRYQLESRIFDDPTDIRQVFVGRDVLVDDALADIYGLDKPAGDDPEVAQIPENWERGGVLTAPGVLAINSTRTRKSTTFRGLYILERFMCGHVRPAPNDLDFDGLDSPDGAETVRAWNDRIRDNPQCAACHNQMDPYGLPFGSFDGVGRHQSQENGAPIDTSETVLGQPVAGAKDLGKLLSESDELGKCLTRQFYRHGLGQQLGPTDRARTLPALTQEFASSDYRIQELVVALVRSDSFRYIADEQGDQ